MREHVIAWKRLRFQTLGCLGLATRNWFLAYSFFPLIWEEWFDLNLAFWFWNSLKLLVCLTSFSCLDYILLCSHVVLCKLWGQWVPRPLFWILLLCCSLPEAVFIHKYRSACAKRVSFSRNQSLSRWNGIEALIVGLWHICEWELRGAHLSIPVCLLFFCASISFSTAFCFCDCKILGCSQVTSIWGAAVFV